LFLNLPPKSIVYDLLIIFSVVSLSNPLTSQTYLPLLHFSTPLINFPNTPIYFHSSPLSLLFTHPQPIYRQDAVPFEDAVMPAND